MDRTTRAMDHPGLKVMGRWAWLLLCGLLPIDGGLVPVPLALTVVLVLVPAIFSRPRVEWRVLWPLFAFYFLHMIGMAWSADRGFGLFDLQVKLGLILLPLMAATMSARMPDALRQSMLAFTAGTLVAIALGLWKASTCFALAGDPGCFSQSTLSYALHPSYAAWYACWAVAYWGMELLDGRIARPAWRAGTALLIVILIGFIGLLASKSGVLGMGAVAILLLVTMVRRIDGLRRNVLVVAGILGVVLALSTRASVVGPRMRLAWEALEHAMAGDPGIYRSTGGSEMRLVAWKCSSELLAAHPFGVGTGDIKNALVDCYRSKGAVPAADRRLNSHSQFLQGGVALGWPGLLVVVLLVSIPGYIALRERRVLLLLFSSLLLVNAAVESVLEVQAGVVFTGIVLGLIADRRSSRTLTPGAPTPHRT